MKSFALPLLPILLLSTAAMAQSASPSGMDSSAAGQPGSMNANTTGSGRPRPPGAALPPGDSSVDDAIRRAQQRDRAAERSICKGC
jgi:hypothetical protein